MKNSTTIILLLIVAVVGGGAFFLSQQNVKKSDSMMQNPSTSSGQEAMMKDESEVAMMQKEGSRYIEYKPAVLTQTGDKKRVLYFYANWCPTCRPADESFRANSNQIPEDVVVIRVNYNDSDTDEQEKGLAQKYGITYQHTYVQIDADGNEVAKWNGGQLDELLANIK